jgi:hypothetical protein
MPSWRTTAPARGSPGAEVRRSSKIFAGLAAAGFLAALAWALVTQANLWRAHARPAQRPTPTLPQGEVPPPESATGVVGSVETDTLKALDKNLQAEREARKRLDAPPRKQR